MNDPIPSRALRPRIRAILRNARVHSVRVSGLEAKVAVEFAFHEDGLVTDLAELLDPAPAGETDPDPQPSTIEAACGVAVEMLQTVDDWIGMASTRQAAVDAMWRLRRTLQRAGFRVHVRDDLRWRGSILRALEQAGLGVGEDGILVRVRMPDDQPWQHASGPIVTPDRLASYVHQHGTTAERARCEAQPRKDSSR